MYCKQYLSILRGFINYVLAAMLLIICMCAVQTEAETHVSGYVSGTWTAAGNPYIADSVLVIHQDSLLVIEPAVIVDFASSQDTFKVFGDLHAWGNESDSIFINWGSMFFAQDAPDDIHLDYCKFMYAGQPHHIEWTTVGFRHCYFLGGGGDNVLEIENSSSVTIEECEFYNDFRITDANAQISNSVFMGELYGGEAIVNLTGNVFNQDVESYWGTFIARENEFNDKLLSWGDGLIADNICNSGLDIRDEVRITRNLVVGNVDLESFGDTADYNVIYGHIDGGGSYFAHNLVIHPGTCIYAGSGTEIIGNTFIFGGSSCIQVSPNGDPKIRNNIIFGDGYTARAIFNYSDPLSDIGYNTFWNVDEYYTGNPLAEGDMIADPRFVDPEEEDYGLLPDSPCIDSADPSFPNDPDNTLPDRGWIYFDQLTDNPPAITSPTLVYALRGGNFSYTAIAIDDGETLEITFQNLPYWLNPQFAELVHDSSVVAGEVPADEDDFVFTVIATDNANQTDQETIQVQMSDYTVIPTVLTGVMEAVHSPYMLFEDAEIPLGDSLTIEPGCLILAKYYEDNEERPGIIARGKIIAEGNVQDSIVFTSERDQSQWFISEWHGLRLVGAGADNSRLKFCRIEAASEAVHTDTSDNVIIENCSFYYGSSHTYIDNSQNVIINNCNFQGAYNTSIFYYSSTGEIKNNIIDPPTFTGPAIRLDYSEAGIYNNLLNEVSHISINMYSTADIRGNIIWNCDWVAIIVYNFSSATIYNNTIYGCYGGIHHSDNAEYMVAKNNIISNCTEYGLECHNGAVPDTFAFNNVWCPNSINYLYCPNPFMGAPATVNINGDSCDIYNNISMNPIFEGGSPFSFYLNYQSPCIDAGTDMGFPYFGEAPDMGAFEYDPAGMNDQPLRDQPLEFGLNAVYPNPFNGPMTLEMSVPTAGDARLDVYDVLGRKVAQLFSGYVTGGYHKILWNAENVSSGTYFVRFEQGKDVRVKKVILLK